MSHCHEPFNNRHSAIKVTCTVRFLTLQMTVDFELLHLLRSDDTRAISWFWKNIRPLRFCKANNFACVKCYKTSVAELMLNQLIPNSVEAIRFKRHWKWNKGEKSTHRRGSSRALELLNSWAEKWRGRTERRTPPPNQQPPPTPAPPLLPPLATPLPPPPGLSSSVPLLLQSRALLRSSAVLRSHQRCAFPLPRTVKCATRLFLFLKFEYL